MAIRSNNLGSVLGALGDLPGALMQQQRALAILERLLPPEHPYIIRGLNSLANCHEALGHHDQAAECRARAAALKADPKRKVLDG
jgi:tetratricopeptide (TPR) repeat protein